MSQPKRRLVAMDVDSTAYHTRYATTILSQALAEIVPGINAAEFLRQVPRFYVNDASGRSTGHDLAKHLAEAYGISFDVIRSRLIDKMAKYNLMYDDAVVLLDRLLSSHDTTVFFVTVGVSNTQGIKLELMHRELERRLGRRPDPIPAHIIEGNKGEYLNALWNSSFQMDPAETAYDEAVLIDDHPEQIGAKVRQTGLRLIQIVRVGAKYAPNPRPDIAKVASLSHAA